MTETSTSYPVSVSVDYPDRPLDRLTTFFRPILVIPIVIVYSLLNPSSETPLRPSDLVTDAHAQFFSYADYDSTGDWEHNHWDVGPLVMLPTILMLLFRRKYPRWWFDWNVALTRFGIRIVAYIALLRDEYPSVEEEQSVHIAIEYPDAASELNRWLPLVKWLLAVPHYLVLLVMSVAACLCVIFAWFAIIFTGTYPRACFDFVVGILRWWLRVSGYAFLLVTDRYPPFSLKA